MKRLLRNRFVRNAATLQAGAVFNAVGGMVTAILLANLLGARLQGEYILVVKIYSALAIVTNIGLVQVAVNQIAGAAARGHQDRVRDLLAFLVKAHFLLSLALPAIGWVVLPWIAGLYRDAEPDIVGLAWLLTWTPLIQLPMVFVTAAFQGTRRMLRLAQTENAHEVMRVYAVVVGTLLVLMEVGPSPLGPVLGLLAATALGSFVALNLYHKGRREEGYPLPSVWSVLARTPKVRLWTGMPLSFRIGAMRNIDLLAHEIVPVMALRFFGSPEWVAYFHQATRLMKVPTMAMQGVSRTALPAMSELRGMEDRATFQRTWTRVTVIGGSLVAAGILLALPFIPVVARWLYPTDYVEPVTTLCLILALGFVPTAYCVAMDTFFIVTNRMGFAIRLAAIGLVVCSVLTVALCAWMPETGAAWGYNLMKLWSLFAFFYIVRWFRRSGAAARAAAEERSRAAGAPEEASGADGADGAAAREGTPR